MSDVGKSITHFISERQCVHKNSTGEMSGLLNDIVSACNKDLTPS
jgi:fructose-1,6-bisphosphatase I